MLMLLPYGGQAKSLAKVYKLQMHLISIKCVKNIMLFSKDRIVKSRLIDIRLHGHTIQIVQNVKFLGMTLDQ